MRSRLLNLLPFIGLGLIVLILPLPVMSSPGSRQVTINAEQFAFDPPVIHVNRGDRVTLTVQAADVVHGLYLD